MKKIIVRYGQTIYDIAIQEYGCFEGAFVLCQDNGISLSAELTAGQILLVNTTVADFNGNNKDVASFFGRFKIIVNSGYQPPVVIVPFYSGDFYSDFYEI